MKVIPAGRALAMIVVISGCDGPAEPVGRAIIALTDRPVYQPGDSVLVRFANVSADTVVYNAIYCSPSLERRTGDSWSDLGSPFGDVPCLDNLLKLPPGASDSIRYGLPSNALQATYRYAFRDLRTAGGDVLPVGDQRTNEFGVR